MLIVSYKEEMDIRMQFAWHSIKYYCLKNRQVNYLQCEVSYFEPTYFLSTYCWPKGWNSNISVYLEIIYYNNHHYIEHGSVNDDDLKTASIDIIPLIEQSSRDIIPGTSRPVLKAMKRH